LPQNAPVQRLWQRPVAFSRARRPRQAQSGLSVLDRMVRTTRGGGVIVVDSV
jgi:hypothetical protein